MNERTPVVMLKEKLKRTQLRNTKDRRVILDLFEADRAWSAKQLHQRLPQINLSTVYRNIQTFTENGLIREVHVHDNEQYYERVRETHHDHLSCEHCDALECVPCPAPKLPEHHIELTGVCSTCS